MNESKKKQYRKYIFVTVINRDKLINGRNSLPAERHSSMTANGEPGANSDESSLSTLPLPDIRTSPMPNGNGSHKSTTAIESQPKRRVSIISDAPMIGASAGAAGYDNLAYEQNPRRKISQVS